MQKSKIYLPDINVWLAIAADGHIQHRESMTWLETTAPAEDAFCRITQMGFLRLLTNAHAMHEDVRTEKQAGRGPEGPPHKSGSTLSIYFVDTTLGRPR